MMDFTEIIVAIAGAAITAAVPVIIAFAVAYGRRALEAIETSKYAEAYSKLDPLVRDAIDVAAEESVRRAVDAADDFGRKQIRPFIAAHAHEAANALAKAAGVRTRIQPAHVEGLIHLAEREALQELDDINAPRAVRWRDVSPSGNPFVNTDELDPEIDESGVPYKRTTDVNDELLEAVAHERRHGDRARRQLREAAERVNKSHDLGPALAFPPPDYADGPTPGVPEADYITCRDRDHNGVPVDASMSVDERFEYYARGPLPDDEMYGEGS